MAELDPRYYINVGPKGTFRKSLKKQTTPAHIDALFDYLEQNAINKMLIYFHGGLVSEDAGMQTAAAIAPICLQAGAHPISFVWETGLMETITRNISTITQTELAQKLLRYILQQISKRWGIDLAGKGAGQAMTFAEIEAELHKPEPFADFDHPEASNGRAKGGAGVLSAATVDAERDLVEVELEQELLADPDLDRLVTRQAPTIALLDPKIKTINATGAKGGVEIVAAVVKVLTPVIIRTLKRRAHKTDHGLYPTVIEELLRELCLANLGAWVWTGMKDAAQAMWSPNAHPITEASHVGTYFLEKLAALKQKRPALQMDVAGHSAGSIAICRMLAAAQQHPGLKMRNIIFLAPGCTLDLFTAEIVAKPERFENFRMFTMHDDYESKDVLVPGLYTRSLVYFVSGVLEDEDPKPIAGLERWLRADAPDPKNNLAAARAFMNQAGKNRLVLSRTGDAAHKGLQCLAISHGDFDNEPQTLASLQFLLAS
jgi:hypothetical protein